MIEATAKVSRTVLRNLCNTRLQEIKEYREKHKNLAQEYLERKGREFRQSLWGKLFWKDLTDEECFHLETKRNCLHRIPELLTYAKLLDKSTHGFLEEKSFYTRTLRLIEVSESDYIEVTQDVFKKLPQ